MVKEIVKDIDVLHKISVRFDFNEDKYLIQDLIDTANAHSENCVGLASIQIGVPKRIIVVRNGNDFIPMINPHIIKRSNETFIAKEGCLSLDGVREVKRHKTIMVGYTTKNGETKCESLSGFKAQIVQHECDHLNGILI